MHLPPLSAFNWAPKNRQVAAAPTHLRQPPRPRVWLAPGHEGGVAAAAQLGPGQGVGVGAVHGAEEGVHLTACAARAAPGGEWGGIGGGVVGWASWRFNWSSVGT